jgi:MoxR-like ATPase
VPDLPEHLAAEIARVARSIRSMDLKKAPSVSETIDWARTLLALGIEHIDTGTYQTDIGATRTRSRA